MIELPTSELGAKPAIRIWGRCSVRKDGKLIHADRAGHPSVSSFFNTDDTKLEYNASEPVNDKKRWTDQFVHLLGHTGGYTREEAIATIDAEGILPDMLSFDPSKPAKYPNGRVFTDDVINYRLACLTKKACPPSGLKPHTDVLKEFPYLGTPHQKKKLVGFLADEGWRIASPCWRGCDPAAREILADLVFEAILPLFDLFHPHADPIDLVHQIAHRARDRIGQPRVIEFHHSWRELSPSMTLPGIPTIVEHGGADDTTTAPAPIRLPSPIRTGPITDAPALTIT